MKKSRSANRNVVKGYIVKAKAATTEEFNENVRIEIEATLKAIKTKRQHISDLDGKILDLLDEANIEEDVEEAGNFELQTTKDVAFIQDYLMKKLKPKMEKKRETKTGVREMAKSRVKLPKIFIKKFYGDPTTWQQFFEMFEATVHINESLSNIEKFSYLKGYLGGAAENCIDGLTLSNDNYEIAVNLLKERYANPQLTIAAHMNKLLQVEKVSSSKNCRELRQLYDQIESHVRSLKTVGINSEHYGPLLIPIILERMPSDIKLEISKKLGTENWQIEAFMGILKDEITSRESCDFLQNQSRETRNGRENRHITTEALYTGNTKSLACAFCKHNHYPDKCNVVTEIRQRKEIVRKNRLCYKCLFSGHPIRKCRSRYNCFKCKSTNHHTAICDKDYRPPGDYSSNNDHRDTADPLKDQIDATVTYLVNSRTPVLLQTANAVISDNTENRSHPVRILLDSGSQKTYVSQRLVDALQLSPSGSKQMTVKTFGNSVGVSGIYKEYRFCVKSEKRGCTIYMSGFAVPYICSPVSGECVEKVSKRFPSLKSSDFSDLTWDRREIDLLIGADYYWTIVDGGIKKCGSDGLTAINTKFGWVLSGPYDVGENGASTTNLVTHMMKIDVVPDDNLNKAVEKLWDLETLGIKDTEISVYDNFLDKIVFKDGRYEVCLPFREDCSFIEDNFTLSKRRLLKLKATLNKDEKLLKKYDEILKEQLTAGVVEKVKTEPTIGEVTYLPHRAVIRDDKKTTKIRIVFDASVKNKGRSLNESLYKGPLLTPLLFYVFLRFRVPNIGLTADIEKAYC